MNKLDKKVEDDIAKYGWHCLSVVPRVGEEGNLFSYTIGLYASYGHPEIIVFGLGSRQAHGILSECVDIIKEQGRFPYDTPVDSVLDKGFEVIFKPMLKRGFDEYLGMAIRYYGHSAFDACVMFWPDTKGKFAWESKDLEAQSEALGII